MRFFLLSCLTCLAYSATSHRQLHGYSFEAYVQEFQKKYGSKEYQYRKGLFDARLKKIIHQNNIPGKNFKLGVNRFTDMTEEEFHPMRFRQPHAALKGSIPSDEDQWKLMAAPVPTEMPKFAEESIVTGNLARRVRKRAFDWSRWPKEVDWQKEGKMTPVHDQNGGSCWAHTAVEALETASAIAHNTPPVDLSVQEIVSCVPNPKKCGGDGGCQGSIVELAFKYVQENGLRKHNDYPFDWIGMCTDDNCKAPSLLQNNRSASQTLALTGWKNLPSNKAAPIMDALQKGPVAIALSTDAWRDYEGGILDIPHKDVIIGHAVLLVGYGEENGVKYWKIRNSWGYWGEMGYIRLKRQEDPDSWCGMDTNNQAGTGCEDDPKEVRVCGSNGILYDPVIVTDVGKIL